MNQEIVSKTIKEIRLKNKLTQEEFASIFGVTYQAVSKWENGKSIPDIDTLTNICKKYNININTLLADKKNNKLPIIIVILVFILSVFILFLFMNKTNDYEVKEVNSTCDTYEINGNAVISNDRQTLLIKQIKYCGDDSKVYKKLESTLIKEDNNVLTIIDKVEGENKSINDYIKDVSFHIDSKTSDCKNLNNSKLYIEIKTTNENGEVLTHNIPLELTDTMCTK